MSGLSIVSLESYRPEGVPIGFPAPLVCQVFRVVYIETHLIGNVRNTVTYYANGSISTKMETIW